MIAVSLGDPSGIGPEVALSAWRRAAEDASIPPFTLFGARAALLAAGARETELYTVTDQGETQQSNTGQGVWPARLPLVELPGPALSPQAGQPDPRFAPLIITAIETAVRAVQQGPYRALVTLPIAKSLLSEAGFAYAGHTEYLSVLAGLPREAATMMLVADDFRVVPLTLHVSLKTAIRQLTPHRLRQVIRNCHKGLTQYFNIQDPRLAVSGLNPHAGENGTLGEEEQRIIAPTLDTLRQEGIRLTGPWSADTLFTRQARESYDAAIAMTHDQALIPIKTLAFERAVNLTLGLPFVRTSPDHGTAFDIAGQGRADPSSFIAALRLANRLAQ